MHHLLTSMHSHDLVTLQTQCDNTLLLRQVAAGNNLSVGFNRIFDWDLATALSRIYRRHAHLFEGKVWQPDTVGVAHHIMDCFGVLGSLADAPDDASSSL